MPELSRFTETYTTFSGADIVCTFGGVVIGSLSGITWSVTREKAPVYTMGAPNPRSFSRGKRGIAGSLIFTMFDRPGLYKMLESGYSNESFRYFTRSHNLLPGMPNSGATMEETHRGFVPVENQNLDVVDGIPYYADQIPPFDVAITFANEYGQSAVRSIYGLEILSEGSGASMDDIVIEETMMFVARDLGPMISSTRDFRQTSGTIIDEPPFGPDTGAPLP